MVGCSVIKRMVGTDELREELSAEVRFLLTFVLG